MNLSVARFVLMIKKGYRDPPYHNWSHAFSVTHFCYLLLKNIDWKTYIEYVHFNLKTSLGSSLYHILKSYICVIVMLQCFDIVGWVTEKVYDLYKLL